MTTKSMEADVTAAAFRNPSSDGSKELTRLFRDLLTQMRNDPLLRAPALSQAALDAIVAYELISGAVNPVKAPGGVIVQNTKGE